MENAELSQAIWEKVKEDKNKATIRKFFRELDIPVRIVRQDHGEEQDKDVEKRESNTGLNYFFASWFTTSCSVFDQDNMGSIV